MENNFGNEKFIESLRSEVFYSAGSGGERTEKHLVTRAHLWCRSTYSMASLDLEKLIWCESFAVSSICIFTSFKLTVPINPMLGRENKEFGNISKKQETWLNKTNLKTLYYLSMKLTVSFQDQTVTFSPFQWMFWKLNSQIQEILTWLWLGVPTHLVFGPLLSNLASVKNSWLFHRLEKPENSTFYMLSRGKRKRTKCRSTWELRKLTD